MKNALVQKFINLVQIDSPSSQEKEVRDYLINWLKQNHFQWKVDKVGDLYAIKKGKGDPILFCGHMDTVEPGRGIKPLIQNGFIKSNGATILGADNKAYLTSLLSALEGIKTKRSIELLFTVKEETGGGIEHFPFVWLKSKRAIIFDSAKPLGGVVLRSPYIYNFYISLKGKAAHASTPDQGINVLSPALEIMKKIKTGESDKGQTTINIGLVNGGSGINTVPEGFAISGEIRSYNKRLFSKHLKNIEDLCKKTAEEYSVALKFTKDGFCPGYEHKKNSPLIKSINKIYNQHGLTTKFYLFSGISDANILNAKGVETINLTDGVLYPHTTNESVATDTLMTMRSLISDIIYIND